MWDAERFVVREGENCVVAGGMMTRGVYLRHYPGIRHCVQYYPISTTLTYLTDTLFGARASGGSWGSDSVILNIISELMRHRDYLYPSDRALQAMGGPSFADIPPGTHSTSKRGKDPR